MLLTQKEQRENRRIKNVEIAQATGISIPTILRWIRGEVTKFETPVLESICNYFECDIGDLLYFEETDSEDQSTAS